MLGQFESAAALAIISPAVKSMGEACVSHVRHLLNRTEDEARYPGVTCVTIFQGAVNLDPVFTGVQAAYRRAAGTFFADVAQEILALEKVTSRNGSSPPHSSSSPLRGPMSAIVVLFDDATLPLAVTAQLAAAGTPLLAHAVRKSARAHAILIPDWTFVTNKGFENLIRDLQKRNESLTERKPVVFWRGRTTGYPCSSPNHIAVVNDTTSYSLKEAKEAQEKEGVLASCNAMHPCEDLQRVRATRLARKHFWLDLKLSGLCQTCKPRDEPRLAEDGLLVHSAHHNELEWNAHRGILEIDGNVNAWGHKWRLASGSAVFKVDSEWTNAYLEHEVAGVHYLPVHANLSNLAAVTRIVTDDTQVPLLERIARNALEFANDFTYEAEVARVAKELRAAWPL